MDDIDKRILTLLQNDARMGYQEIGESVGLSGPAVFQRVRKLEEQGVLTGFHAAVDPRAVGRAVTAFVRVIPGPETDAARMLSVWRDAAEIQECHLLTGRVGYQLKVRVSVADDLEPLLDAVRRAGCEVEAELALATMWDHRRVPVF